MENLYKPEEYSDKLPNPHSFPIRGGVIIAIKDKPYAFCDGFMLDLLVRESDKKVLEGKMNRAVGTSAGVGTMLEEAKISNLMLSEPEFIYDFLCPVYVLFTPHGNPVGIQVKYYRYFRNRNKNCKFYKRDEDAIIITIKVREEVVGLCMPMLFEEVTINKILEERNNVAT